VIVGIGSLALGARTTPAHAQFELTGTAWEVVERSYARGDSSWVNSTPQPGRYLFTERHYSVQEIRESGPRASFDDETTDAERLRAFDVFHAHGGTYEVSGDRLLLTISIAKGPNTMDGGVATYGLRWRGVLLEVIRTSEQEDETRVTTLRRLSGEPESSPQQLWRRS
jgi:hypothetical protein